MLWKAIFLLYLVLTPMEYLQPGIRSAAYQATSVFLGIMIIPRLLTLFAYAFNKDLLRYGFIWGIILTLELYSLADTHTVEIIEGILNVLGFTTGRYLDPYDLSRLLLHLPVIYVLIKLTIRRPFFSTDSKSLLNNG